VQQGNVKWCSKDRFAAKRLRTLADGLSPTKRAIIEQHNTFRAFMNVLPFNIPNELIDYVAENTTPALREFKVGKKGLCSNQIWSLKYLALGLDPIHIGAVKEE
jgi:hypothetical protein